MEEENKARKNKGDNLGCVDYRKYTFARLIMIDDGLAERGLTLPLLTIMVINVCMESCSFISIFLSTQASVSLNNVRSFLLGSSVTLSLFNQYISRKEIARLHDFFEKSFRSFRTDFPEERTILDDARKAATAQLDLYVKIFACNTVAMIFAQPLGGLLSGNSWKKLPVDWTFPPSDNEFSFWLIFLFQVTGVCIAHCVGIMIMSFTSITIQMTALFDVLVFCIENVEKRATTRSQQTGRPYHPSLLACLKDDVAHYQQLIRELSSATPYLRNTVLIISAAVPMVMACEAYPLMQGNIILGDLVKSFLFLSIQFLCWAQTCSRLETMTDRHDAVFNALYDSPWFDTGFEYRKLVFNTMTFSTHPKYIKARLSNEVTATMATFYSFVMSSFNLLNMIRNIG
uniref:Olfactory receptor 85 n=1 Tax=Adelphocoris lineolatus TaxID=236346 RepID=A0A2I4PHA7_ADELI|nr:olfactory receptor 85 [Adelphocoris lineolatus]